MTRLCVPLWSSALLEETGSLSGCASEAEVRKPWMVAPESEVFTRTFPLHPRPRAGFLSRNTLAAWHIPQQGIYRPLMNASNYQEKRLMLLLENSLKELQAMKSHVHFISYKYHRSQCFNTTPLPRTTSPKPGDQAGP